MFMTPKVRVFEELRNLLKTVQADNDLNLQRSALRQALDLALSLEPELVDDWKEIIISREGRDCVLNAMNNAATAKYLFLSGGPQWKIINKFNACLSWAYPLLGVGHPMFNIEDPASQLIPLRHEDTKPPNLMDKRPSDPHSK